VAEPLSRQDYRLLALAGVVQAASLVHATANGRPVDDAARRSVLAAVTTHRAESLAAVFAEPAAFTLGLGALQEALTGTAVTPEVARYALQLVDLAGRLQKNTRVADALSTLLDGLQEQPSSYALGHIYEETIATLGKRVQVTGDGGHLRQEAVAADVRALLLGGVRFAWLWHQLGGRRWQLILRRRDVLLGLSALQQKLP
jgi:high frequency lysogenization protein